MSDAGPPLLDWHKRDIEQRLGFKGGRFTRANNLFTFLCAAVLTVVFFFVLHQFRDRPLADMFLKRGATPYAMAFLAIWSLIILVIKWSKLRLQRKALKVQFIPSDPKFNLSSSNVDDVLANMRECVDDPRNFVLLNRIQIALANLRNLGRVGDVDEILRSHAELDESTMETSYSLIRGFVWAIPVLGFIGTVMGLSQAIGGFGRVVSEMSDNAQIIDSLKVVTGGLATAFETTLVALVAALTIQLLLTFLNKAEQEFLDDCTEYCQKNVVSRLRVMPFEVEVPNYGPTT